MLRSRYGSTPIKSRKVTVKKIGGNTLSQERSIRIDFDDSIPGPVTAEGPDQWCKHEIVRSSWVHGTESIDQWGHPCIHGLMQLRWRVQRAYTAEPSSCGNKDSRTERNYFNFDVDGTPFEPWDWVALISVLSITSVLKPKDWNLSDFWQVTADQSGSCPTLIGKFEIQVSSTNQDPSWSYPPSKIIYKILMLAFCSTNIVPSPG